MEEVEEEGSLPGHAGSHACICEDVRRVSMMKIKLKGKVHLQGVALEKRQRQTAAYIFLGCWPAAGCNDISCVSGM